VSWGTRIFAFLVLLLAIGTVGAFLLVVLPARVGELGRDEAHELSLAQDEARTVDEQLVQLWADIGTSGGLNMPQDRVTDVLNRAKALERQADDALAHAEAARTYLVQADGVPFQLHAPTFVAADQPRIQGLESGLQAAIRLAHGAFLQMTVSGHVQADYATLSGQLMPSIQAGAWTPAARAASDLQIRLKTDQQDSQDPETLIDPLWARWIDAMSAYAFTAQHYALAAAANDSRTAQQLARTMAANADQMAAARAAAIAGGPAWQLKTVKPLLDTVANAINAL
jgi:hypothetical protein